jgi:hypothetical protein
MAVEPSHRNEPLVVPNTPTSAGCAALASVDRLVHGSGEATIQTTAIGSFLRFFVISFLTTGRLYAV